MSCQKKNDNGNMDKKENTSSMESVNGGIDNDEKNNETETQIKKYRILDNKLNESAYNIDNLKLELNDL